MSRKLDAFSPLFIGVIGATGTAGHSPSPLTTLSVPYSSG